MGESRGVNEAKNRQRRMRFKKKQKRAKSGFRMLDLCIGQTSQCKMAKDFIYPCLHHKERIKRQGTCLKLSEQF